MTLGYDGHLYILAFDHRGSFQKKMFGIGGDPSTEESATIADAKSVIYEGFRHALDAGAPKDSAGILIDEQFGADAARDAKGDGVLLAMPVEKSGRDDFEFEYGGDFGAHIEDFDPSFSKVLVRYNPDGDQEMNRVQSEKLKKLSDWLHEHNRKFLFELLVPATVEQLESVGGDTDRYDQELRPKLMLGSIGEIQGAGIEPDIWKIEGLDSRSDADAVSKQARSTEARKKVGSILLGRGSNKEKVHEWLKVAAPVDGFIGFAVGRTNFSDPLKRYLKKEQDEKSAVEEIAENYKGCVDAWKKSKG
jgi:myo-inositol catabolism protein IolC